MNNLTLKQIYKMYPSHEACIDRLEWCRWYSDPECCYCDNEYNNTRLVKENRYHCNSCHKSFSVTTNTMFHRTRVPLQKWFFALWFYFNCYFYTLDIGFDFSVRNLASVIKVNKNTATRMSQQMWHHVEQDYWYWDNYKINTFFILKTESRRMLSNLFNKREIYIKNKLSVIFELMPPKRYPKI
jgi:transposase-like protein